MIYKSNSPEYFWKRTSVDKEFLAREEFIDSIKLRKLNLIKITLYSDWSKYINVISIHCSRGTVHLKAYSGGNCQIIDINRISNFLKSENEILDIFDIIKSIRSIFGLNIEKLHKYVIDTYVNKYELFKNVMKNNIIIHNEYKYQSTYDTDNHLTRAIFSFKFEDKEKEK